MLINISRFLDITFLQNWTNIDTKTFKKVHFFPTWPNQK